MAKYLDSSGLGHYDTKIKGYVDNKVNTEVTIKTIKLNGTEVSPASKVVNLVIDAAKIGADEKGTAATLVISHKEDANAHSSVFEQYVKKSQLGTEEGDIPVLDANGKLNSSVLPAIAITETYPVASQTEMLALDCQKGDVAIRSDISKSFILSGDDPSDLANWLELKSPDAAVISVAGKTGAVMLVKGDVGLGNVDNTSDVDKPISMATQTALNGKVSTTRKVNGYALSDDVIITKADIGLGSVNNTSDADKPISAATQKALDDKQNKTDQRLAVESGTRDVVTAINDTYSEVISLRTTATNAYGVAVAIVDGSSAAKRAIQDSLGNKIDETYATIADLADLQSKMTAITDDEINALFA